MENQTAKIVMTKASRLIYWWPTAPLWISSPLNRSIRFTKNKKQLPTYLKLAQKRLRLLINFNSALLKDGITRIVNGFPETA